MEAVSGGADILKIGNYEVPSRAYLGRFNFKGTDQQKRVGDLSGGERGRLHLADTLKRRQRIITRRTLQRLRRGNSAGFGRSHRSVSWLCISDLARPLVLDRVATHILAYEGDSEIVFFEGNYTEYHEDFIKRKGKDSQPKRVKYKPLKV